MKKKPLPSKSVKEISPFWLTKSLDEMTRQEWESLCDGCAKCCLHKFIDDDSLDDEDDFVSTDHMRDNEEIHYTNIVCHLLNDKSCQCSQYQHRTKLVPDCVQLTQENLSQVFYMPPSCSYRRLKEGRGLPSWHPLLNRGKKSAMHKANMSIRGKVVKDDDINLDDFSEYIVRWPLRDID